jgi:hypothetical protein
VACVLEKVTGFQSFGYFRLVERPLDVMALDLEQCLFRDIWVKIGHKKIFSCGRTFSRAE